MTYYAITNPELQHFGVKGQKWGVRRYQNEDGSLTSAGKKHVGQSGDGINYKQKMKDAKAGIKNARKAYSSNTAVRTDKFLDDHGKVIEGYSKSVSKLKADRKSGKINKTEYKKAIKDLDNKLQKKGDRLNNAYNKADMADRKAIKDSRNAYKQSKANYKEAVKSNYNNLQKKASIGDKLMYNNATRKHAAKLMAQGANESDAMHKAKKTAVVNSAIALAVGGTAVALMYR